MKRPLTPPSISSSDGLVVRQTPPAPETSRKRIRLSRLSLEGRVDWILDLHVPPGGTVTCVPGFTGGNLRVEELQDHTVESPATNAALVVKQEAVNPQPLSPVTQSSDDSSSSTPSSSRTVSTAPPPSTKAVTADILHSLTTNVLPESSQASREDSSPRHTTHPPATSKPPSDRAVIVVSAPPPPHSLLLKGEIGAESDAPVPMHLPQSRTRPQITIARTDSRPHIKAMPMDTSRPVTTAKLDLASKYANNGGRLGHTTTNIKAARQNSSIESAPKSRVHFTANGSIPFCRMPQCGRAMYFYKNEDRWRCNLNRGGCGAVFHNVDQDIGPCSKCQRPVSDGDPCYDWCVCRYCTSSKRQSSHSLQLKTEESHNETMVAPTTQGVTTTAVYVPNSQLRPPSLPTPLVTEDGSKNVSSSVSINGSNESIKEEEQQLSLDHSPLLDSEAEANCALPVSTLTPSTPTPPTLPMEAQHVPSLQSVNQSLTSSS